MAENLDRFVTIDDVQIDRQRAIRQGLIEADEPHQASRTRSSRAAGHAATSGVAQTATTPLATEPPANKARPSGSARQRGKTAQGATPQVVPAATGEAVVVTDPPPALSAEAVPSTPGPVEGDSDVPRGTTDGDEPDSGDEGEGDEGDSGAAGDD